MLPGGWQLTAVLDGLHGTGPDGQKGGRLEGVAEGEDEDDDDDETGRLKRGETVKLFAVDAQRIVARWVVAGSW